MQQKPGLRRRTQPAICPPILGLFGIGLAWRAATPVFGLPEGASELFLGAITLLYLFALTAWLSKPLRRPAVLREELGILPGRAGVTTASLSLMLLALTMTIYNPALAFWLAVASTVTHLALAMLYLHVILTGPVEQRAVTPVWHLAFVGFIVGPLVWMPLNLRGIAELMFVLVIPVMVGILVVSLRQLLRRLPPAPLRPLLAVHLAPPSFCAINSGLLGYETAALAFAAFSGLILLALLVSVRFLTAGGFSPLWGSFTFPAAAFATMMLTLADRGPVWRGMAGVALVAATLVIVPIAFKILQAWARGGLAAKTNAATV